MLLVGTDQGLLDLDTGRTLVDGQGVTALAPGPNGWHALLDRQVIVQLDDGAAVTVGELSAKDGQSLAVLSDGAVVVGRAGAHLTTLGSSEEVISTFESVTGRDLWINPADSSPDTRSMATGAHELWVNVHVGGLWQSWDSGETWKCVIDPDADIHEVRANDELVAVAAAVGFGWSSDKGKSWSWSIKGLHRTYLRAVCIDGESAYVSASEGPFTNRGAVYRAVLGSHFVKCQGGLPEWFPDNIDTGHLDAANGRAVIGFEERVYVSEDSGTSWFATEVPGVITTVRLGSY